MMNDISVMPKEQILSAIEKSKNIIIISHARPDGDCLGAAFAMREFCLYKGKAADTLNDSPLPDAYKFIEHADAYNAKTADKYDLAIVVDCAAAARYQNLDRYMRGVKNVIWIDHHLGDTGYGSINWVDMTASSTCEMVYKLLISEYINKSIANYLFMGISTDTGHFMHNNVSVEVLDIAVDLVRRGAEITRLCTNLYKRRSLSKTKLIARAIDSMRFYEDGSIAVIPLTAGLLSSCGITTNDTEGIIDFASAVAGVKVAVCMSEEKNDQYKVSFRSRTEDVAAVAEFFGGGGHKYAAGCQIFGYFEDVIQKLVKVIKDLLWTE